MDKTFQLKDPTLPLVLSETDFKGPIWQPISAFVDYVNALLNGGYHAETLPEDYGDLYSLDYYDAQVRNGGHSQFIGNSGTLLEVNLSRAACAAHRIGLPDLAALVDRCAAFCRENPELAATQDGFQNRAPVLDELDAELYAMKFTLAERAAYFAALPSEIGKILSARYTIPDLDETAEAAGRTAERLRPRGNPEFAALEAARLARKLFEYKLDFDYTPGSKAWEDVLQREMRGLVAAIQRKIETVSEDVCAADVAALVRESVMKPGLYDLSRYHIHAAAWIATHPNLEVVPRDAVPATVNAVLSASPFAVAANTARKVRALSDAVPSARDLALARAFADLRLPDARIPLFFHNSAVKPGRGRENAPVAKTAEGQILQCTTGDAVSLYDLRACFPFTLVIAFARLALSLGLIGRDRAVKLLNATASYRPGKRLAHAPILPELPRLFRDLHLPEALFQWTVDGGNAHDFPNGVLDAVDVERRRLTWRYPGVAGAVVVTADPGEVRISDQAADREERYPAGLLRIVRANASGSPIGTG